MNAQNRRLLARHRAGEPIRQWDDVRCYRCGRWRPRSATVEVDARMGMLGPTRVAVCSDEDACRAR